MNDMNNTNLIGRLTKDAEIAYTAQGYAIAKCSIAVNRSKKNGDQWVDEASFFEVKLFGKTAENLQPYLKKGKQIAVEGFLKQERWEKDGQKFSKVTIGAENVQLLGPRDSQDGGYGNEQQAYAEQQQNYGGYNAGGFPEDIPFGN